ncbi:MAG: thioredoxin family protein, partial [Bdellovibrio sp.]
YELQMPAFIRNKLGAGKQSKNILSVYLTGLFAGIVASPCVGPVLVAILTYVASTQNKIMGFLYLFTYALGLGLIFIVLGLSNQLIKNLPRSGSWMNGFKFILGSLMLSGFYYYLNLLLPDRWYDLALGVGLVILSSVYGAFLNIHHKSMLHRVRKGLMQGMLIIGIGYMALGALDLRPVLSQHYSGPHDTPAFSKLNWRPYSDELLVQAAKSQKPVIIDFWAEWCAACHELEQHTFSHPDVRNLAEKFVLLKFDATQDSPALRTLKKKYNIQGLPTVIFINPHGMWIDALTLTQFEKPDQFLKRMQKVSQ